MAYHVPATVSASSGRHFILSSLLLGAAATLLIAQFHNLPNSILALRQARLWLVVLAAAAVAGSYVAAALSYQVLARHRLRFRSTLLVQIASGLTNRIAPAGLGSLGLFAAYYHRQGHSLPVASAVAATNNILGVVGNLVLLAAVVILHPHLTAKLRLPVVSGRQIGLILLLVLVLGLIGYIAYRLPRAGTLRQFIRKLGRALGRSLQPDRRNLWGLICNMTLTSLTALALSWSVAAIGGALSWPAALLCLSVGTLVGTVTPTPGGLGGVEAGLVAGLVAFEVPLASALAAVLVYRGLTYWLPLISGLLAFRSVRTRYL